MEVGCKNPAYSGPYFGDEYEKHGISKEKSSQQPNVLLCESLADDALDSEGKKKNFLSRLWCCGTKEEDDYTSKFKLEFWNDGEISEKEEREYYKSLLAEKPSKTKIRSEVMATTVNNYMRRLKVLIRYVKDDLKLDLNSEVLRGPSGETLIYIAAMHGYSEMVEYLLKQGSEDLLFCKMGSSSLLAGSNFLHGCVINGSYDVIDLLMNRINLDRKHELIHGQAHGSFFYDAVKTHTGQPLCLALWCGYKDIYDLLVKYGAQLDIKDEVSGNTIFHTLVYHGVHNPEYAIKTMEQILNEDQTKEWYCRKMNIDPTKLKPHWMYNYFLKIENYDGYTPVTLAAMLGVHKMLTFLLQLEGLYKFTRHKFGPMSTMYYDMSEIDPAVTAEVRPGKPSILELLIYDNDDDDLPILSIQPVRGLMSVKWQTYKVLYIIWGIIHLGVMITFSMSGLSGMNENEKMAHINGSTFVGKPGNLKLERTDVSVWESLRFKLENLDGFLRHFLIFTGIGFLGLVYLALELVDIGKSLYLLIRSKVDSHRHYRAPLSVIIKFDVFRVVNTTFALCILGFYISHMKGMNDSRQNLALASVFGWYFCLFFTRAYKPLGFFTVMVHRILLGDLVRFAVVIFVIMIGFGVAMRVMFIGTDEMIEDMSDASHTIQSMFRLMVGLSEFDFLYKSSDPDLTIVLFVMFVVLTTILLLNMLIAAMSDTYATISGSKDALWRKQRVASMLLMDRRTPAFFRRFLLRRFLKYDKEKETYLMLVKEVKNQSQG